MTNMGLIHNSLVYTEKSAELLLSGLFIYRTLSKLRVYSDRVFAALFTDLNTYMKLVLKICFAKKCSSERALPANLIDKLVMC